ncbi:hypothetical protein TM1040_0808 [Ruegeria sp. TM1040]|uniref:hypothetical protein n=1 Tax=Ruegeria sp. (strain TM1040) TaxID=292414 RepID=UPI00005560AF|nr:hypothetical protein [Ruegeria sp. TM1040]ABF63541.1 hypothetical protein TM1040_0808 [Ruegeria sp. TM1040]
MSVIDNFPRPVQGDVFRMLCGEMLGSGAAREVFECAYDPSLVVKIENAAGSFQNIAEWQMWWDAQHIPHAAEWLAPCVSISPCGIVLIQKRTTPAKRYPEKLPAWLTDTKRTNYGMIGKRFVCHDYGVHLMCNSGLSKRKRKVEWWDAA